MQDLISRQAAIDKITEYGSGDVTCMSVGELKRRIEQLPPAQTDLSSYSDKLWKAAYERGKRDASEDRKTGKWIELDSDEDRYDEIKCPHCRHIFTVDAYHWTDIGFTKSELKFCPNCGADMRGIAWGD